MKKISKELKQWMQSASANDVARVIVTCSDSLSSVSAILKPVGSFDTIRSGKLTLSQIKSLMKNSKVLSIELDSENIAL